MRVVSLTGRVVRRMRDLYILLAIIWVAVAVFNIYMIERGIGYNWAPAVVATILLGMCANTRPRPGRD